MGDSLVAGLRPEQTSNMGEAPSLKAGCWLGPAFAAKVKWTWPKPNKHWCQAVAFKELSATPKAERPPGPAALRSKAGWAVHESGVP